MEISEIYTNVVYIYICKILPIAMGLSVSVCQSVTFVRTGRTLAKIKNVKNEVCRFWYLPLNGVIAKIVLHDIDLNFQGQTFEMAILTSKR